MGNPDSLALTDGDAGPPHLGPIRAETGATRHNAFCWLETSVQSQNIFSGPSLRWLFDGGQRRPGTFSVTTDIFRERSRFFVVVKPSTGAGA